jgi:hypothetical protein
VKKKKFAWEEEKEGQCCIELFALSLAKRDVSSCALSHVVTLLKRSMFELSSHDL